MEDNNILVEIVLRKRLVDKIPDEFIPFIEEYKQFESNDRYVMNVPRDWTGLKDGTIVKMFKTFGEGVYVALAYLTQDEEEMVTDFDGNPVDKFEVVHNGRKTWKYVKKRLRIVKVFDKDNDIFEVKGYVINMKYVDSVVNVLSVYSVGSESGLGLSHFVKMGV